MSPFLSGAGLGRRREKVASPFMLTAKAKKVARRQFAAVKAANAAHDAEMQRKAKVRQAQAAVLRERSCKAAAKVRMRKNKT